MTEGKLRATCLSRFEGDLERYRTDIRQVNITIHSVLLIVGGLWDAKVGKDSKALGFHILSNIKTERYLII